MKKIVLFLVMIVATSAATAQFWTWGFKVGTNISTLSNAEISSDWDVKLDTRMKTGVFAGIVAEYRFLPMIGLQGELYYSRQGVSAVAKDVHTSLGVVNFDFDVLRVKEQLNYLNLPIVLKIYPIEKLSIEIGPQIGYMLTADNYTKTKNKYNKSDEPRISKRDNKIKTRYRTDQYEALDYGVTAGVSYKLTLGLWATARYYYGMQNVFKTEKDLKNQVIQLGITTKF